MEITSNHIGPPSFLEKGGRIHLTPEGAEILDGQSVFLAHKIAVLPSGWVAAEVHKHVDDGPGLPAHWRRFTYMFPAIQVVMIEQNMPATDEDPEFYARPNKFNDAFWRLEGANELLAEPDGKSASGT
ncbi:MAG: hypothetical protein ACR2M5_17350 [Nakamurella sp.]